MRWTLLYFSLFLSCQALGQSAYGGPNLIFDGAGASDLAAIDMDNDGDLDLLVVKEASQYHSGYWYENQDGQGNFSKPQLFDHFDNVYDTHLEIADLNGDGLADIIACTRWLENTGSIDGFIEHQYSNSYAGLVYPADMDNDGDIDLLLTTVFDRGIGGQGNVYWLENSDGEANFVFSDAFGLLPNNHFYSAMNVIDSDGDGDSDVVAGIKNTNTGQTYIRIYGNMDGTGNNMQVLQDLPIGGYIVQEFSIGDRNGDGLEDFATLEKSPNPIGSFYSAYAYFNYGAFSDWVLYAQNLGFTSEVQIVDFTGMGKKDLVVLSAQHTLVFYDFIENEQYLNTAGYQNTNGINIGVFADFNSDGQLDLIEYARLESNNDAHPAANLFYNDKLMTSGDPNPEFSHHIRYPRMGQVLDWDKSGTNDVLLLEGDNDRQQLAWIPNQANGNFLDKEILIAETSYNRQFELADINNDGNQDVILTKLSTTADAYLNDGSGGLIKEQQPMLAGKIFHLTIGDVDNDNLEDYVYFEKDAGILQWKKNNDDITGLVNNVDATLVGEVIAIAISDLNNDTVNDIFVALENGELYAYYNTGNGNFTAKELLNIMSGPQELIGLADINQDGFKDIIFSATSFLHTSAEKVVIAYFDPNSNTYLDPVDVLDEENVRYLRLVDIDADGDLDIYTNYGLAINISGTGDFFMNPIWQGSGNYYSTLEVTQDIDGDGLPDKINLAYGTITWQPNIYNEQAELSGKIIIDANDNCNEEQDEALLPNTLVRIQHAGEEQYANSSLQGYYGTITPDLDDYTLEVIPPSPYWIACEADTTISIFDTSVDYVVDFHLQAEVDCPLLSPSISVSRLRPCLPGLVVINYCNYGTVDSEISLAEVNIPVGLVIDSINYPVFAQTDSTVTFELQPVSPGYCQGIFIYVTPDCTQLGIGSVVCPSVAITPNDLCAPINIDWDGSTIEVSGTCVGDTAVFNIQNIGEGDMDEFRQYRVHIINDDIIMLVVDTFQLKKQETKTIKLLNIADDAMRMEADQDMDHPVANVAAALVQNCQGLVEELWATLLQSFPQFNGDPFYDVDCQTLTGSFDPNEKVAQPTGFGDEHYIQRNWELDYTIYFQNTGNDTAFLVEIIDTLSPHLDISTLRVNNSTHPYVWNIGPANELIFTFENILLPDSFVNVLGSQGFIEYSIQPKTSAPFNTPIENRASIYFDFNDPILTNTVFHTIKKPEIYSTVHHSICAGEAYLEQLFFTDTTLQQYFPFADYDSIAFHHLEVKDNYLTNIDTALQSGTLYLGEVIEMDTLLIEELVASNGCDSLIEHHISVIISSIDGLLQENVIQVFPIPTKDFVYMKIENIVVDKITVYDAAGKLIIVENEITNGMSLDLKNYAAGVYHLQFDGAFGKVNKRMVKVE